MRVIMATVAVLLWTAGISRAQSLFILQGERAAEGSLAWSVGPFSQGVELQGAVSLDGRWDVGFGVNRYATDFGGAADATFTEWTPSVRYFLFKEDDDGTPVSVAGHAQYFHDAYGSANTGWYLLAGADVFKRLTLAHALALYPYVGFSLAADSFRFGTAEPDRSVYLTRQFGVHTQWTIGDRAWLRLTVEEHSFRRETYRAVRAAYGRRF